MVADLESKELWKLSSLYVWERGAGDTPLVWRSKPAGLQNLRKTGNLRSVTLRAEVGEGKGWLRLQTMDSRSFSPHSPCQETPSHRKTQSTRFYGGAK